MNARQWLKKVILFPAMALGIFGNEGVEPSLGSRIVQLAGDNSEFIPKDDVLAEQDAAASEDVAADADQQGNQGEGAEDGLDTASDEEGSGADQDEDGDADETDQKDEEGKGTKKKTFEERMAEIEAKLRQEQEQRIAALEAKFSQSQQQDAPLFVDIDRSKVNVWLKEQNEKISEAELDEDYVTAEELRREKAETLAAVKDEERKKAAWEKAQAEQQNGTQQQTQFLQNLDKAADFYREHKKIDGELWKKMGDWFAAECQRDPVVGQKFAEKARHSSIEAIEWAHQHTVDNMGQQAKQSNQQKEQSKTKTAAVAAAPAARLAPVDLKAAQAAFKANPSEENFAAFMAAKRKAKG